jgi:uncharacterized glyoxalase superfamily protein PhnB
MPKPAAKKVPDGMHTVTPHLVCAGAAEAIEFYKKAFGATEVMRLPSEGGKLMHASVRIGNSMVFLVDENPSWMCRGPKLLGGSPVTIHLQVEDADATYAQAVAAGATAVMPLADMFWGDRYGIVADPFGHQWSIATHQYDFTPEEFQANMAQQCKPS